MVVFRANALREILSLPGPSRERTKLHAGGNHVGSTTTVDTEYSLGSYLIADQDDNDIFLPVKDNR